MPLTKSTLQKMNDCIAMMDAWLTRRNQEIAAGTYYDDEDTDPVEFLESPGNRKMPVAEPPAMPQEDSAPQKLHGAGTKDLFK
jgi:hypothetical protein